MSIEGGWRWFERIAGDELKRKVATVAKKKQGGIHDELAEGHVGRGQWKVARFVGVFQA